MTKKSDELTNYGNQLKEIGAGLETIFRKGIDLTPADKKDVINLFIKTTKIKKKIAEILFSKEHGEGSARARILAYLKDNVGKIVTGDELAEVGSISEFARRVRELRHECGGWQISTGMNRSGLRPDEYVLESLKQKPVYERMNAEVWAKVLERDNFTCHKCGWKKGDPQTNSRRFLEVHHKTSVLAKGKPVLENLVILCNVCHDASS